MYNSLYVITILKLLIPNTFSRTWTSSHCRSYLRHHQPSIGHHLLRIEYSISNEQSCEQRCSIDHQCSMVTYHRRSHRCHLFQDHPRRSHWRSYRSNHAFSTYANCPGRFSFTNHQQKRISYVHCNYDLYTLLPLPSSSLISSVLDYPGNMHDDFDRLYFNPIH